jgi:hypothetical protein
MGVKSEPAIIHYDFADIRYSSFYSAGFYLAAPRYGYRFASPAVRRRSSPSKRRHAGWKAAA